MINIRCYDKANRYKFTVEIPTHDNIAFKARAHARKLNRTMEHLRGVHKIGWIVVDGKEIKV